MSEPFFLWTPSGQLSVHLFFRPICSNTFRVHIFVFFRTFPWFETYQNWNYNSLDRMFDSWSEMKGISLRNARNNKIWFVTGSTVLIRIKCEWQMKGWRLEKKKKILKNTFSIITFLFMVVPLIQDQNKSLMISNDRAHGQWHETSFWILSMVTRASDRI